MNAPELLSRALEAQQINGPWAPVEILLKRFPYRLNPTIKRMRLKPKHGPWGRIVKITAEGTYVRFEAIRLIAFVSKTLKGNL